MTPIITIEAGCLVVDTLLCSETSISICYNSIILLVEDRINGKRFLIEKKEDSIPVILQVIQPTGAPLQTLLSRCCTQQGFPGISQIFSYHLFDHPAGHSGE